MLACALIFDETVLIRISGTVDPSQCRFDGGQRLDDGCEIAGAFRVKSGKEQQQREIDAAVVQSERHFAQRRHLAAAHLVQDLSRLGIGKQTVVVA